MIGISDHEPVDDSTVSAEVSEIRFSDVNEAMEGGQFDQIETERAVSSGLQSQEFDPQEVAQDLVNAIHKYGLDNGAEPPEGYEARVSNPED